MASASLLCFHCLFIPSAPTSGKYLSQNGCCYLKSLTVTGCLSKEEPGKEEMVSSLKVSISGSFCLLTHLSEEHCFPVEVDLMAYCHTKLFSKENTT